MATAVGLLTLSISKGGDYQWRPKKPSFDYVSAGYQMVRNLKMSFIGMNKKVQQQLRRYNHG
jgi:hypothetical protein